VTVTAEETPKRRRGRGLPPEELQSKYPSLRHLSAPPDKSGERAWVAVFNLRPDAMHAMFADLIKQVHATPGRIGQRPMPKEEEVDFQSLVYGEQNEKPLTDVLPGLVKISERAFAEKIHMSRAQYQRMLKGQYHPDVKELRLIAQAVRKPAAFFVEYRKIMVLSAFVNLIEERPGIATMLYRDYLTVRMGE
jgi:transcriptional regulator with XRE-family HTH domain